MAQILFKNANLLDPEADALQGGMSVLVEDELIREVSAAPIRASNAAVIDCEGRTLMPGLIDSHVHVMLSEVNIRYLEAIPLTLMTVRAASLMRAMLDRGFTTVRDTGGADWGLRDGVAQGLLPGPRMFIAGRALGPMLVQNQWADGWIWYIGPFLGGALAALAYEMLYLTPVLRPRPPVGTPESGVDEPRVGEASL